jgi:hypothetical protein
MTNIEPRWLLVPCMLAVGLGAARAQRFAETHATGYRIVFAAQIAFVLGTLATS